MTRPLSGALAIALLSGLVGLAVGLGAGAQVGLRSAESRAAPVRLIGLCDGRLLGALEEGSFPAGCVWIEPIRF